MTTNFDYSDKPTIESEKEQSQLSRLVDKTLDGSFFKNATIIPGKSSQIDEKYWGEAFSEDGNLPEHTKRIKTLILWSNYDVNKIIEYALKNKEMNIILAPKSFMIDQEVNERYSESYGTAMYQTIGFEGQKYR